MSKPRILITDSLEENGLAVLRNAAEVVDQGGISAEALHEAIADFDALIVRARTRLTAALFEHATRLKVVGRAGVGVDNVDLGAAQAHGVTVVNAPSAGTTAVAEHTFALMLALARDIPRGDAALKSGQWIKNELNGVELAGKVLGVVGIGRIGQQVARRAAAFRMAPIGYDHTSTAIKTGGSSIDPVTLAELYQRADFITLHVPLTPETRRMIDGQALSSMKRGVRLVCTARGGLIDEMALAAALDSGQVAGAALDVFENEPPGLTALVAHPRVVTSPHIGAQTVESQRRTAQDIAEEVLAALAGDPLRWRIV